MILFLMPALAIPLINEVHYDAPSGQDESENEWVEICNSTEEDIDISGWGLERAGSEFISISTFDPGTIVPSEGYLVIWGPFSSDLQNGGSDTDGVRLVNQASAVVDTVLYDSPNNNNLTDDWGSVNGPFAPDVSAGHSLARFPDCAEINNDGSDWVDAPAPTPGAENTTGGSGGTVGGCEQSGAAGSVVINEFLADPSGSDSGHEWVELLNTTGASIDVSGWVLAGGASSFSTQAEFPSGTTISAYGYLVIGGEDVIDDLNRAPDVIDSLSLGNAGSNADAVRLEDCSGAVVDTVVYGETLNEGDGWIDDLGQQPSSFAPKPRSGQSTGRVPDGFDSDNSGTDFQLLNFSSPWEANDLVPTCDGSAYIKINEFIPNPDSEESSADETFEWVELFNNSDQSIDLSGWSIQWGTSSYANSYTLPVGSSIWPNSYFLVGGEGVDNPYPDAVVSGEGFSFGSGSSNADAIRLLHCGPGVADTVVYGPTLEDGSADNEDGWVGDDGLVVTSLAPKPSEGASLSRRMDGVDSDNSGIDFYLSAFISPGSSNPVVICAEGAGAIKINEALPNPDGSDGGQEWVEFFNAGETAIELDGWRVETFGSSWSEKYAFPTGTILEPGEFFLLAEEDVPSEVADDYTTLSLGNASTGFDGIRLLDCPGEIQDVLFYGKEGAVPSEDEDFLEDQLGGSSFIRFPDSGKSIGRYPDGVDSDNIASDFQTDMEPSPGRSNSEGVSLIEDTGELGIEPPGKGCGQSDAPESTDPTSKCSSASSKEGFIFLVSLLLLSWRRRA